MQEERQLNNSKIRAFIAIEIPEDIKKELLLIQNKIRDFRCIKIVDKKNVHITLNFLGNVDYSNLMKITKTIDEIGIKKTDVYVKGLGFFPSLDYARVLWAGIYGIEGIINAMREKVRFGSITDKGHATIARIKCKPDKMFFEEVNRYKTHDFGHFTASEIVVFKSVLKREGPEYEKIAVIKLY
ncbi:MAG: RNA 2',3'-cyclic phosphodiesterase [Candidatus Anstonellales archaeon]